MWSNRRFLRSAKPNTWVTTPCTCQVSQWHLTALGVLPPATVRDLLASTCRARGSVLLDDLMEHVAEDINPVDWVLMGQLDFSSPIIGLSIEQICRQQGVSLLGFYHILGVLEWEMHPLILWYEQWIEGIIERDTAALAGPRS